MLLQIVVILAVCRLLHEIVGRVGQPPVIGEIVAGLLLGPSFLGWIAPPLYGWIFPAASLPVLNELSQIGLVLFMFLVGIQLNLAKVYALRRVAGLAGLLSIVFPFAGGLTLARPLHALAPSSLILPFSLFIAVSMSITAFPVLARILADQKLSATKLGHVAIACAALNDVLAWTLLAWIVAITRSREASIFGPIATVAIYVFVMFAAVRPALRWLTSRFTVASELSPMLTFVFFSSWVTELAGIHALFGAFLAGVIWPRNSLNLHKVTGKIEPIAMEVLIPLFFSYSGLRTNISALAGGLWLTALLVVAVAIAGKVGGAFSSTATQHGGQETTLFSIITNLLHFGMTVVGLPYSFQGQMTLDEITGGSPYGATTIAGGQGQRQPSANELNGARFQGKLIAETAKKLFPG